MVGSEVFISADLNDIEELISKEKLIHVYRIIQESLNNAMKYAEAGSIRITAERKSSTIELMIQDNGKGFDKNILEQKAQHHFGMLSIEERLKMMNGVLEIETHIGKGTKLIGVIPIG